MDSLFGVKPQVKIVYEHYGTKTHNKATISINEFQSASYETFIDLIKKDFPMLDSKISSNDDYIILFSGQNGDKQSLLKDNFETIKQSILSRSFDGSSNEEASLIISKKGIENKGIKVEEMTNSSYRNRNESKLIYYNQKNKVKLMNLKIT